MTRFWPVIGVLFFSLSSTQAQTATLRGQVIDETHAVIPGAKVSITGPASGSRTGKTQTAVAGEDGSYQVSGLVEGVYRIEATAPQLALPQALRITVHAGVQTLELQLRVTMKAQEVAVQDSATPAVGTDPTANASAIVLRGDDLQALGDSPDDLAADLQALAGPSAGPNGGAIFIDGFSGGELPSKESIREIRINQNPFSPEYDKLGFGRIEIFTKPGSDKFRGTLFYNFGDDFWNSRNPYAAQKAPFLLKEYGGNLSGPLNKRASFFLDVQRHAIDNGAIINGTTLDPNTLRILSPYTEVHSTPQRRIQASPRIDYQLSQNHTLLIRYAAAHTDIQDSGVGSFNLVTRAFDNQNTSHTIQITETAVIGSNTINEARFQLYRLGGSRDANSNVPALQVLGAFNGGGAQVGHSTDTQTAYEFQNYTSVIHGKHAFRFGVRLRGEQYSSVAPVNFGGTFTFGGGGGLTSIERYQLTLQLLRQGVDAATIRARGGGATQFSINQGEPAVSASQVDAGLFFGDDWRIRPNLTASLGVRCEAQSNLHDRRDFAPRIGLAWAPGAAASKTKAKSVFRLGFGMFYDRFAVANTITALRYNGILQQQYVISNPDFFPNVPKTGELAAFQSTQVIERTGATLRVPYIMQGAAGYERQLPKNTTVAVTYATSHGLHQFRSEVVLPGPFFVMGSNGLYNQNQLITNVNTRVNKDISLFGSYVMNRARSNTDGLGTFPANPRDYSGEYGPASTDVHNRGSFGGTIATWRNIRLSPLLVAESGPPFDITTGGDLYGTTLFNGRPGIATDPKAPGVIATSYGLLDPNPKPGQLILSRNSGRGPGAILFNARISKVFTFGSAKERASAPSVALPGDGRRNQTGVFTPAGGGGGGPANPSTGRRYNLTISMSIRNVLNHTNPGPIIGNITSPLFGVANQPAGSGIPGGTGFSEAANNRRLELQTRFTF